MPSIDIKEINVPDKFELRPSLRGSGTINMILKEGRISVDAEWRCDPDGNLFQFRAWLKNNGHEELLGEGTAYSDTLSDYCRDDDEDPNGYNRTANINYGGDIITQYKYGDWSKNTVGEATLIIENGFYEWSNKKTDQTWEFPVEISPAGLPVKENARISSKQFQISGDNEIAVNMDITNPANHGIEFPVTHEYNGQKKETSHTIGGSIDLNDTKTENLTDILPVDPEKYGPITVITNGIKDTTPRNYGGESEAESNVSIVDCDVFLRSGTQYLHETQVLDVSVTIENTNTAEVPVQVAWESNGSKILSEEIVAKGMSETVYEGELEYNMSEGDNQISVNIESVNV